MALALECLRTSGQRLDQLPKIEKPALVIATDFEGPCVLGDTAASVMSKFVPNGARFYQILYAWYTEDRYSRRLPMSIAQEGTDIALTLPLLLLHGVTNQDIQQVANESRPTPGAREWIDFVKSQKNSQIVAVTTAWQEFMTPLAKNLGIDHLVGTPFPIDDLRSVLQHSGSLKQEMDVTQAFADDVSPLLNPGKLRDVLDLDDRFSRFYHHDLGDGVREIIQRIDVVGNHVKGDVAAELFRGYENSDTITVTIGDGLNDCLMLMLGDYSIAVNGPDAAQAASIGVITPDLRSLVPVFKAMMGLPKVSIRDVVEEARKELGGRDADTIIHTFRELTPEIILRHRQMRRALRGQLASMTP